MDKYYDYKYHENTRYHKWCCLDLENKRKRLYEWMRTHVIGKSEFDFYLDKYIEAATAPEYKEEE